MAEGTELGGAGNEGAGNEGGGSGGDAKTNDAKTNDAKTNDAKTNDAKGKEGDGKKDDAKAAGAPEKYEDFKFPDKIEAPAETVAAFSALAKDLNLSQENAQKIVDFYFKTEGEAAGKIAAQWKATHDEWTKEIQTDKTFGGSDENTKKTKEYLAAFFASEFVGDDADKLREGLNLTGAGNLPALYRVVARIGKAMVEDKGVTGKGGAGVEKDVAKRLFPGFN